MTGEDRDRQLFELVRELRGLHAEAGPLRVEHERHAEQLREACRRLGFTPCPLRVAGGRLVDAEGADVVFPGHSDFARVLGCLREVEGRLATVYSRFADLGVPPLALEPNA